MDAAGICGHLDRTMPELERLGDTFISMDLDFDSTAALGAETRLAAEI
jgi:hypothetical protein